MSDDQQTPWAQPDPPDPMGSPPRCTATNRQGDQCRQAAVPGATVCHYHGGAAPQVRAAADRRIAHTRASEIVRTLGLSVEVDPHQAILDELYRCAGAVAWLAEVVGGLDPDDVVWGRTLTRTGDKAATEHRAAVNIWVQLYAEWVDRKARIAKAALDAGVAERVVRLEERKGEAIAQLLAGIFDDAELRLTPDQQVTARVVAARHLRALTAPVL